MSKSGIQEWGRLTVLIEQSLCQAVDKMSNSEHQEWGR
jgi:hypothetical protein